MDRLERYVKVKCRPGDRTDIGAVKKEESRVVPRFVVCTTD